MLCLLQGLDSPLSSEFVVQRSSVKGLCVPFMLIAGVDDGNGGSGAPHEEGMEPNEESLVEQ